MANRILKSCLAGLILLMCGIVEISAQETDAALAENAPEPTLQAPQPGASLAPDGENALLRMLADGELGEDFNTVTAGDDRGLIRYAQALDTPAAGALITVPEPGEYIPTSRLTDAFVAEFQPNGWSIVALQMPLLGHTAELSDYQQTHDQALARLEALVQQLEGDGIGQIVVVASGENAARISAWLAAKPPDGPIKALVTRGRWSESELPVDLPRLELIPLRTPYAEEKAVHRWQQTPSEQRRTIRILRYPQADRSFAGVESLVARDLRGWLRSLSAPL